MLAASFALALALALAGPVCCCRLLLQFSVLLSAACCLFPSYPRERRPENRKNLYHIIQLCLEFSHSSTTMDTVDAATSPAPPVNPVAPPVQADLTESNTPERPADNENPLATDMDTTEDPLPSANQLQPETPIPAAPETEPEPEPEATPETTPQESEATQTQDAPPAPAPESTEAPPPPPPEEEPATWADIVEDTSSPDEEELKEIEAGRGDYSAMECKIYLARDLPVPAQY